MSFSYNFEESKQKLTAARDEAEEAVAKWAGSYKDMIRDCAATVNAPTFTSMAEKACTNIDACVVLFKDLIGEEGDEATNATVYGAIKFVQRGAAAMGLE